MTRVLLAFALAGLCALAARQAPAAEPSAALERAVADFAAAREAGDAPRAAQAAEQALALGRAEYGADHPAQSYLLEALASLHADWDRWADAEHALRQALAIRETALGPWHPALTALLDGLADALLMQGRAAESEPFFRRALAIRERHLGPDHPEVAMSLDDLSVLYADLGRVADARALGARSAAILAHYDSGDFRVASGDEPAPPVTGGPACGETAALADWCRAAAAAPPSAERFPAVEAPGTAAVGVPFAVVVSLTEDAVTPEAQVRAAPGVTLTEGGGLRLPAPGGLKGDAYDVVLSAPGFAVEGSNMATIVLPREGDSPPALFRLAAEPIDGARQPRKLFVTFWRDGAYVAKVTRQITVAASAQSTVAVSAQIAAAAPAQITAAAPDASPADAAGAEALAAFDTAAGIETAAAPPPSLRQDAGWQAPDLTVYLFSADRGGAGEILIQSPHLQLSRHLYQPPEALADWLEGQYATMLRAATDADPDRRRDRTVAFMRGFGAKLWREFAPSPVKEAFWRLRDQLGDRFASIQVYTDDPTLPWELMRPSRGGAEPLDFLGVGFRVARWHVSDSGDQLARPPQSLAMRNLLAVAPDYAGAARLPAQDAEMAALEAISGFRRLPGDYRTFARLVADMPDGVVHFSGHGSVKAAPGGAAEYSILLSDGALDLTTWRGLAAQGAAGRPLFFFNACDVGQAGRIAGFVDGWAPAVLEAGASGYIGGLWPLSDGGAYDFAATFYTALETAVRRSPAYLADLLRSTRARFYQTGDPTWLAYGFYGDVNLRVDRDWAAAM